MNDAINFIDVSRFLSTEIAWKYKIVPIKLDEEVLTLFIDNTRIQQETAGELELITGYRVELVPEQTEVVESLLRKVFRDAGLRKSPKQIFKIGQEDFLSKIIREAKELQSSDIHLESFAEKGRVRFRIDGKLLERYLIPKEEYASFINKIKIRAKLDIAEKRLPQDGRILYLEDSQQVDIRVSTLPTLYGEKVVLRLLSNDASKISLESLGLDSKQLADVNRMLRKPHGIILISGPTGSGKTTTLYATLKILNKEDTNILTIEDPIEYTLDGVNQVQLKENIGLGFASALKTFLRQDPDIIMLGEIRDGETAQMAIRTALTGHLVLSTIHTNSAWGTVSRLIDMGIPPFLLSATLNITIAQRLVRALCPSCKVTTHKIEPSFAEVIPPDISHVFIAQGCNNCFGTGYIGRIALYEVIPVTNELSEKIKENSPQIDSYLKHHQIATLKTRALSLLKEGMTSIEEVYPILLNN